MHSHWIVTSIVAAVLGLANANTSQAAFAFVGSRAALAGTDSLDWGTKGPEYTILSNPFTITSTKSVVATVSQDSGASWRLDQGSGGGFAPSDKLLWITDLDENDDGDGEGGPVKIMFGIPLSRAGMSMQVDYFGAFTAKIEALDANGTTVLASFIYSGVSNGLATPAVYTGISTTVGSQFYGIRITGLTDAGGANFAPNDFAINRFDFSPVAVPVPAGMVLALSGLPALGFAGWVRRRFMTAS